jgi:hypothetical protein
LQQCHQARLHRGFAGAPVRAQPASCGGASAGHRPLRSPPLCALQHASWLLCPNFLFLAAPPPPFRPPATGGEQDLEREALLGGIPDVEAGGAAAGKKQRRSWLTLVGVAARYMWPDSFWLQVGGLTSSFRHRSVFVGAYHATAGGWVGMNAAMGDGLTPWRCILPLPGPLSGSAAAALALPHTP